MSSLILWFSKIENISLQSHSQLSNYDKYSSEEEM